MSLSVDIKERFELLCFLHDNPRSYSFILTVTQLNIWFDVKQNIQMYENSESILLFNYMTHVK